MTYSVETRWGGSEENPTDKRLVEIIAELKEKDSEHPDTWMIHDSGWTLIFHEKGIVIWSNPEQESEERHLKESDPIQLFELWKLLANGNIDELEKKPWKEGHGIPPQTPEERQQIVDAMYESNKEFYDQLGDEIENEQCKEPGCTRGRIYYGVFCRIHHFEMIRKIRCPFDH